MNRVLVFLLILSLTGCLSLFTTSVDLRIVNNTASDKHIELQFANDGETVESFNVTVNSWDRVRYSDALKSEDYTLTVNVNGEESDVVKEPVGGPDCTPPTLNIVIRSQDDVRYFYTCED